MSNHLYDAHELKDAYPEYTNGFTVFEIEKIWEEYSETYAAGWIEPNENSVYDVFTYFDDREK